MKKKLKIALALLIVAATLLAFIAYARSHPELLAKLTTIRPSLAILLLFLYGLWFLALVFVLRISMHMFGKSLSKQENILLNAYSSLINFFGPGQSGPAFRGLYLYKRHGLAVKQYFFATLLYYGFYAVLSALLLSIGSLAWWQTLACVSAAAIGSFILIRSYQKRARLKQGSSLQLGNLGLLFAATLTQVVVQTIIFYFELREVQASISLAQVLTYTGAANLTLFVAITPGGIGIREAFLVFTGQLHHVSNIAIVAASVIDRAVYLLFLGILFVLMLGLHAKDKLRIKYYMGNKS